MSGHAARKSSWIVASSVYAGFFYAFLYLPILTLALLSVNDSTIMGFPMRGVSLRWYEHAFGDGELMAALWNSLLVGIAGAAIATMFALLIALGLRRRIPLKSFIFPIILIPLIIPGIVSGVLLLVFMGFMGISYGLWTTVLPAHVTWVLPFAFLTLQPQVQRLDKSLEEAAMDLGARPHEVFLRVIFPILRPAVIATLLFSFTISFDEFIRTLFVMSSDRTVPTYLWVLIVERTAPFLPAIGVVLMVLSAAVAGLAFVINKKSSSATH